MPPVDPDAVKSAMDQHWRDRALRAEERLKGMLIHGGKNNPLRDMVIQFHEKYGHPVRLLPAVPDTEEIKFRLKLITEEFVEVLESVYGDGEGSPATAGWKLYNSISEAQIPGKMWHIFDFIDGLADLMYVIEGTFIVYGVNDGPVFEEVHRANMDKEVSYVEGKDQFHKTGHMKPKKPEGWKPPDIKAVLEAQRERRVDAVVSVNFDNNLEVKDVKTSNMVNHPKHYNSHPSGIECITIVQHFTFCLGNAIKYIWRNGLKEQAKWKEDLEKAIWYIKQEISRLEKSNGNSSG